MRNSLNGAYTKPSLHTLTKAPACALSANILITCYTNIRRLEKGKDLVISYRLAVESTQPYACTGTGGKRPERKINRPLVPLLRMCETAPTFLHTRRETYVYILSRHLSRGFTIKFLSMFLPHFWKLHVQTVITAFAELQKGENGVNKPTYSSLISLWFK